MNPFYFSRKELSAARDESTLPLFPEDSDNEYFYTELFNYYHSLKGKTIDTGGGESLFPIVIDKVHSIDGERLQITKIPDQRRPEASPPSPSPADIKVGSWKFA